MWPTIVLSFSSTTAKGSLTFLGSLSQFTVSPTGGFHYILVDMVAMNAVIDGESAGHHIPVACVQLQLAMNYEIFMDLIFMVAMLTVKSVRITYLENFCTYGIISN